MEKKDQVSVLNENLNGKSFIQILWGRGILKMQMFATTSEEAPIPEIDPGPKQTKKSGYNQFLRQICQDFQVLNF